VAFLKRLGALEQLRQQKQSGIWIEDVVGRFIYCVYTRCETGFEAASRFGNEASDLAVRLDFSGDSEYRYGAVKYSRVFAPSPSSFSSTQFAKTSSHKHGFADFESNDGWPRHCK
jgi:hypothetical protein